LNLELNLELNLSEFEGDKMARHHRKHHRRHHARRSRFSLGFDMSFLKKSSSSTNMLMGVAAGFAGIVGIKWAINKFPSFGAMIPSALKTALPLIGSAIVGGVLFAMQKNKNQDRAVGHLVGALAAGTAVTAHTALLGTTWAKAGNYAGYADYAALVSEATPRFGSSNLLNVPGFSSSQLMNIPGYGALIDDKRTSLSDLSALAADGMGDDLAEILSD
jgi:hypothetical protein